MIENPGRPTATRRTAASHFPLISGTLSACAYWIYDTGIVATTRRYRLITTKLDEIDIHIIRLLQQDARVTNVELARQLPPSSVSEETVRRKRHRLVQEGVLKITGVPDARKMGYVLQVVIGLRVETDRIDEVADAMCAIDEVGFVWLTAGSFDILAWAAMKSTDDLNSLIRTRVVRIEGVKETQTFIVLESTKQEHGLTMKSPPGLAARDAQ